MRISAFRLSTHQQQLTRVLALSSPQRHTSSALAWPRSRTKQQRPKVNLGAETSLRRLHTTQPSYRTGRSPWAKRGMRGRLRELAGSLGLVDTQEDTAPADEPVGEELYVMPGWAVAKLRDASQQDRNPPNDTGEPPLVPFDLHVSISGYCALARPASRTTRTQRVMVSLVRRFAALPNLPGQDPDHQPMGPLPAAVGMAFLEEAEENDKKAAREKEIKTYKPYVSKRRITTSENRNTPTPAPTRPSRQSSSSSDSSSVAHFSTTEALTSAHDNLHRRLAPFWSNILPNRRVLFDVYATPQAERQSSVEPIDSEDAEACEQTEPIHSFQLITDSNGHFSQTIVVPWENLCSTPSTAAAAFDSSAKSPQDALLGWQLRVRSRLDYEDLPPAESDQSYRERLRRAVSAYGTDAVDTPSRSAQAEPEKVVLNDPREPQVVQWTSIRVGRADGVHIISDLDDTVKHSDILSGPREVFRNVFCRPLDEICVPEMDAMYRRLESKGVQGFHFVSNSPSQLFPSIRRFLTINAFPARHSIKLKYYGGRSIFSSLYDSPAERKRGSLRDLFEAFPKATLVMLGDSAEQDLELYVEFAQKYPGRVGVIAIRDVTSDRAAAVWRGIEDLVDGVKSSLVLESAGSPAPDAAISSSTATPSLPGGLPEHVRPVRPTRASSVSSVSSVASEEEMRTLSSSQQKILQRAATWETRMEKARKEIPKGTELYFYKDPLEIEQSIVKVIESNLR